MLDNEIKKSTIQKKRVISGITIFICLTILSRSAPKIVNPIITNFYIYAIVALGFTIITFFIAGFVHYKIFKKIMYYDLLIISFTTFFIPNGHKLTEKGWYSILGMSVAIFFGYLVSILGAWIAKKINKEKTYNK